MTGKPHGPWSIKSSRQVYTDPFIQVRLDQVIRPDGQDGQHVVVHQKPGVCVLPHDGATVYLTSEFHYGIGRISLEGVSGGIEPGESTEETALRELQEEMGFRARQWNKLSSIDPFTSITVSPTQLFLASELEPCARELEGTEIIDVVTLPLERALQKVVSGEISHSPTCILIFWLALQRGLTLAP